MRLREATSSLHTAAERTPFVRCCMDGKLARESWSTLLGELHPVYVSLERACEELAHDEPYRSFARPELARAERLSRDLAFLGGKSRRDGPGARCAAGIERMKSDAPHRLLGHAYARYFGDLMGGRILRRAAQRSLGLDTEGVSWLEFETPEPSALVRNLRAALDSAALSEPCLAAVEDEGCRAFQLAIEIFALAQASGAET